MASSYSFWEFCYSGGGWLDVVCGLPVDVLCFGEYGVPLGDPRFPEWCEVFEEFVGEVNGLAVLSYKCVVFLGAHGALDGVSFFGGGCRLWLVRPNVWMLRWHYP